MSELMSVLEPLKRRSRYHRNEALEALKEGDSDQADEDFTAAREAITEAINRLKYVGAPDPQSSDRASEAEIVIAEQLADCWGILGGIYRAQGDDFLADARDAYDEGNKYESSPRFNILSSYNRVNRLVVRILIDPELLSEPPPLVADIDGSEKTMRQLLSEADSGIERQLMAGRRDRVWALADLVTVRLLGGLPRVDTALNDLEESTGNDTFPYESMLKVIRELVSRDLPMQDMLVRVGERLREKLPRVLQGEPLGANSASA